MDNLTIECIWYQSKRDFNKFVRSIEDPQLTVIDYSIIKNKLIKADPYHNEPNSFVIGLNIMSYFNNKINSEKKTTTTIVYSFSNLEQDTVNNFKEMVSKQTDREIEFVLNILHTIDTPCNMTLDQFDRVNYINND